MPEDATGQVNAPSDFGEDDAGVVKFWLAEWARADKREKKWRDEAQEAMDTYRDEKRSHHYTRREDNSRRFNILYSNTVTLASALYGDDAPRPDVRRRYRDNDQVGRWASTVLERALAYSIDSYDFDDMMNSVVQDYLLPGRGVPRVRYIPKFDGDGDDAKLIGQEVIGETVSWDDFRIGAAKSWSKVPWVGFILRMKEARLKAEFGDIGSEVKLDWSEEDESGKAKKGESKDTLKRGTVYEIWDEEKRQVLFIAPSVKKKPLRVVDDPLNLRGFFPVPRPIYSIRSSDSLIPKSEYHIYADEARELNQLTVRISRIIKALKVRGAYNNQIGGALERVLDEDDNALVPVDGMAALQGQGFDKHIWTLPLDKLQQVLAGLYTQREQTKQTIFEVTGIADIFRGVTKASETAEAQGLKARFGSLRLDRRQSEVNRLARDLIRLKAEIIAEQFSVETLQAMTGVELLTSQQKDEAPSMLDAVKQTLGEQPLPPELQKIEELLQRPTWEEVMALLRSDVLRGFRIHVETDETLAQDAAQDRQDLKDFLNSSVALFNGMAPLVQQGLSVEVPISILKKAGRRFRMGREFEDAIDSIPRNIKPPPDRDLEKQKRELAFKADEGEKDRQNKLAIERTKIAAAAHETKMERVQAARVAGVPDEEEMSEMTEAIGRLVATVEEQNRAQLDLVQSNVQAMASIAQSLSGVAQAIQQAATSMAVSADAMQQSAAASLLPRDVVRDDDGNVVSSVVRRNVN